METKRARTAPAEPEGADGAFERLVEASAAVHAYFGPDSQAAIGIVLGSGLGLITESLVGAKIMPYSKIPHMPQPSVSGHGGELFWGKLGGRAVFCLSGRSHPYEGHPQHVATFGVRLLCMLGCSVVFLTNAAGGSLSNPPGTLMCIRSHLNLTRRDSVADTWLDSRLVPAPFAPISTELYSARLGALAHSVAGAAEVVLKDGVYVFMSGPTFETPAEISGAIAIGGHAFGMSTVPEVYAARALGAEVFAVSMICNYGVGLTDTAVTHEEVKKIALIHGHKTAKMLSLMVAQLEPQPLVLRSTTTQIPTRVKKSTWPAPTEIVSDAQHAQKLLGLVSGSVKKAVISLNACLSPSDCGLGSVQHQLALHTLAAFPQESRSSQDATLVLVAGGSSGVTGSVLWLSFNHPEGLSAAESSYLTILLSVFGITEICLSVLGARLDDQGSPVSSIASALNLSRYRQAPLEEPSTVPFSSSSDGTHIAWISGPTFPTSSEHHFLKKSQIPVVAWTTILPALGAAAYGIESHGVLVAPLSLSSAPTIDQLSSAANAHRQQAAKYVRQFLGHSQRSPAPVARHQHAAAVVELVINKTISAAKTVETVDAVVAALRRCIDPLTTRRCVAIPQTVFEMWGGRTAASILDLGAAALPAVSFFSVPSANGPALVLVFGAEASFNGSAVTAARVAGALGISQFVILSQLLQLSGKPLENVGAVVVVRDQINMTGANALTGENHEGYGARFPNMENCYDRALTERVRGSLTTAGLQPRSEGAVVWQAAGVAVAEGLAAAAVGCTEMAPEPLLTTLATVWKHMERSLAAIGLLSAPSSGTASAAIEAALRV
eukprot:TRINITY_DN4340_c0_g1_i2.p1 TRINITY_DN4340_c0_g1~~TRINITY_DN4340_c0_g1_i2.p1  ORF type:complete len:835 (+),score=182.49 TRINITY_DN4340_c0_g1_i2:1-2505(+)